MGSCDVSEMGAWMLQRYQGEQGRACTAGSCGVLAHGCAGLLKLLGLHLACGYVTGQGICKLGRYAVAKCNAVAVQDMCTCSCMHHAVCIML